MQLAAQQSLHNGVLAANWGGSLRGGGSQRWWRGFGGGELGG